MQAKADTIGWVITRDLIALPAGTSRLGFGQCEGSIRGEAALGHFEWNLSRADVQDGVEFKLYDDDGEHYYSGVIAERWLEGGEVFAFAPLQWGAHDAGCTTMKILERGKWETL